MSQASLAGAQGVAVDRHEQVIRRVFWHLVPFLFVLYVVSYLDRINIGFAALSMNKELGLTPTTFGFANTVFYIGYVLCEVPSNLLLVRYGAHRWIPRIMVSWGLASAATMFAAGPHSLYWIRFLVGVAEAGFLPGILLYMTYWLPPAWRARATAIFMVAQPVTIAFGATLSGFILDMHGILGLSGWRWLFLIEGLPAVLLGVIAWFYLDPSPAQARWLSAEEKALLAAQLDTAVQPRKNIWAEMTSIPVLLLCLSYFGLVTSLNTMATWTPQIVREAVFSHGNYATIGLLSALPAAITVLAMPIWSARSDVAGERFFHYVAPAVVTGLGWIAVIAFGELPLRMLGLILATAGAFTAMVIFWTVPASVLSERGRPAGIALISSAGILASAVSPSVVGVLRDLSGSFASSLWYAVCLIVISIGGMVLVRHVSMRRTPQ
ncbi:MFS transporter [Bradyrhizobium sp. ARR65]|uniref:MFS transporter n=1 Tax=Bradyrhizobium sp. ARR65 TaxID=1040989 RepID=UPI0004644772|nr:MFS transporter [Bradyrhizobium sp. ARR65]